MRKSGKLSPKRVINLPAGMRSIPSKLDLDPIPNEFNTSGRFKETEDKAPGSSSKVRRIHHVSLNNRIGTLSRRVKREQLTSEAYKQNLFLVWCKILKQWAKFEIHK